MRAFVCVLLALWSLTREQVHLPDIAETDSARSVSHNFDQLEKEGGHRDEPNFDPNNSAHVAELDQTGRPADGQNEFPQQISKGRGGKSAAQEEFTGTFSEFLLLLIEKYGIVKMLVSISLVPTIVCLALWWLHYPRSKREKGSV